MQFERKEVNQKFFKKVNIRIQYLYFFLFFKIKLNKDSNNGKQNRTKFTNK